jgi:hypothetical protein
VVVELVVEDHCPSLTPSNLCFAEEFLNWASLFTAQLVPFQAWFLCSGPCFPRSDSWC